MNQFFKNINIFSCQKIHFFLRKISKIGHISQEFLSFFEKIFKILIFLEELYKSREIPDELYYLVETFIKKAKKLLRWRTTGNFEASPGFFSGRLSGHLNSITRPLQGVRSSKILKIFDENFI